MRKDIEQELHFQKMVKKININLIKKISLKEDLSEIFRKEISKKIKKGKKIFF